MSLLLSASQACGVLLAPTPSVSAVSFLGVEIPKDETGAFSIQSGDLQALKFQIFVSDSNGNALANEKVTWSVAQGNGTFASPESLSNSEGFASNTFTPPTQAQDISISIATRKRSNTVALKVKAGPLHRIELVNPTLPEALPTIARLLNQTLGTYRFKLSDENGNPISNTEVFISLLNPEKTSLFRSSTTSESGEVEIALPRVAKDGLYQFVAYTAGAKTQSLLRKRFNVRVRSLNSSVATENLSLRNNTSAPQAFYAGALSMDVNGDGLLDWVENRYVDDGSPSGAMHVVTRIRDPNGIWSSSHTQSLSPEAELNWNGSVLSTNTMSYLIRPLFGIWNTRGDGEIEHYGWNSINQQFDLATNLTLNTPEGDTNNTTRILDLNLDGYLDYVGVMNNSNNQRIAIHYGGAAGSAHSQSVPIAGDCPVAPLMGDFNGDGLADMVNISQNCGASYSILRNIQNASSLSVWSEFSSSSLLNSSDDLWPVLADVDSDGNLDFVSNSNHHNALIMWGLSDGSFSASTPHSTPRFGMFSDSLTLAHDIDGDGLADLVYRDMGVGTARWVRNLGNRNFHATSSVWMSTGASVMELHIADMDGNGTLDGMMLSITGGFSPLNMQYHFGAP